MHAILATGSNNLFIFNIIPHGYVHVSLEQCGKFFYTCDWRLNLSFDILHVAYIIWVYHHITLTTTRYNKTKQLYSCKELKSPLFEK